MALYDCYLTDPIWSQLRTPEIGVLHHSFTPFLFRVDG